MLTLLADKMFTATRLNDRNHNHNRDMRNHWAGRFDTRNHHDATKSPYRFNRYRDLW
jgi:hypothetical protein